MLNLGPRKVKQEATALQIFHFTKHHSFKNTNTAHCNLRELKHYKVGFYSPYHCIKKNQQLKATCPPPTTVFNNNTDYH